MLGSSCRYDRAQHERIDTEIMRWVNRNLPPKIARSLFLYRHRQAETFVIAQWVDPCHFVDVINLDKSLSGFDRPTAHWLQHQFAKPLLRSDAVKLLRIAEQGRRRTSTDENRARSERMFHRPKASMVIGWVYD